MVDNNAATDSRLKKPVFPSSLETLKRPGVNITGVNSTVDGEGGDDRYVVNMGSVKMTFYHMKGWERINQ